MVQDSSKLFVFSTTFLDNTAKYYGSVVAATFSSVSMDDSSAENNACSSDGGVFYLTFTNLMLRNSRFIGNVAEHGGAMSCVTNSTCTSMGCVFVDNRVSSAKLSDSVIFSRMKMCAGLIVG